MDTNSITERIDALLTEAKFYKLTGSGRVVYYRVDGSDVSHISLNARTGKLIGLNRRKRSPPDFDPSEEIPESEYRAVLDDVRDQLQKKGNPCKKCGGTGKVFQHANVQGGICFRCQGTGIV